VLSSEDVKKLAALLKQAARPCDLRNLLAHGHWWRFDLDAQIMTVRRDKLRPRQKRHLEIKAADIDRAASELIDIEAELYKLQPSWPLTEEERSSAS
jgi:hypothetical protein